jgi:myo-inositol-1(or 4)-monophosphatase
VPHNLADELLGVAREAADAAVDLIHAHRPDTLDIDDKSSATDHVTQMDRASELLIRRIIGRHRPTDTVVGEEGGTVDGTDTGTGAVTWWLDPIDGTTNYVYDHPGYAVSIAAAVGGRTVAAVVADPTHGRTYWATRGGGAFCNGRELRLPAGARPLTHMLVATGFGYDPAHRAEQGAVVARLLPRVRDIRRMGAAAVDLCSVAAGRVDAYFEAGLSAWDLAAGSLVAEEAGALLGAVEGGPPRPGSVVVAHPDRFEEFRDLIVACGARGT